MLATSGADVGRALHIVAVLGAYGLPLAYPLMLPWLRKHHRRAMPGVHAVQHRLNVMLTGPGTALVLAFGAYTASKEHAWGEHWVHFGLGAILVIGAVGGWIVKASRQMAELARADIERAPDGAEVLWGPPYEKLYRRYAKVELFLGLVVVATIFVMATKPF